MSNGGSLGFHPRRKWVQFPPGSPSYVYFKSNTNGNSGTYLCGSTSKIRRRKEWRKGMSSTEEEPEEDSTFTVVDGIEMLRGYPVWAWALYERITQSWAAGKPKEALELILSDFQTYSEDVVRAERERHMGKKRAALNLEEACQRDGCESGTRGAHWHDTYCFRDRNHLEEFVAPEQSESGGNP